ncbi:DUF2399 domain-containing protein [Lysinibacillus sp. Y5S-8]|uniref:DUF2399 domain-containing protein n=1 Tax=Lysinibacillus sp. Y5S-8 TaxID=3122488 RepID=UPI0030CD0D23
MHEVFIQSYFLKKDELIEKVEQQEQLFVMTIVKKTARTFRKVAHLKLTMHTEFTSPLPKKLASYKFTPNAKRTLHESNDTIQQWLQQGWIVREIRYHTDGISVKEDYYRIGPAYIEEQQKNEQQQFTKQQQQMQALQQKAEKLALPEIFQQAIEWNALPKQWTVQKRMKYIEFCLAFYALSVQKDLFDFKEIGASLHDKIGGSKVFDQEREAFLAQLEQSRIDPTLYGLVSIGKIVPIYFTGNIQSSVATYAIGAVHATTDNAVLTSPFTTTSTTLWLVENRAILTRMAVETEFLRQTNSCIVCLDGQIRSAHKQFIEQLLQSAIKQTIIWTDTDNSGITIAKYAAALVKGSVKIVGRDYKLYHSIESYAAQVQEAHEQEQQLGGVEQWIKWM